MTHAYAPTFREASWGQPIQGSSDAAKEVWSRLASTIGELRESLSLKGHYELSVERLQNVADEAAKPDWDGYGALAVAASAITHAQRFLAASPDWVPAPEIAADPDGEVSLDWFGLGDSVFSVSVSRGSVLTYAGVYGLSNVHGREVFGDEWPEVIVRGIRRLAA